MKETRKLYSYTATKMGDYLDSIGVWFYELIGWRYVKTSSSQNRYVEKKTYLVSDGRDGLRLEDRYKSTSGGYDLCHILERETTDPQYAKYCELEEKIPYGMWDDDYTLFRSKLEYIFTDNKFPKKFGEYKHKFIKYYIYGVLLLAVFGLFMWYMLQEPKYLYDMGCNCLVGALATGAVVCIIRGIVVQIMSLNKSRVEEKYLDYLEKWFEGKPYPEMCDIIKEALKLEIYR